MTTTENTQQLTIIYRSLSEIIPYARNARTHSEAQVQQIAASITEFGWTNPVLIDEFGDLIAGHGRVMAAETLGLTDVPAIILTGLSAEQKQAYRIADNKLALNAGWDTELLKLEFAELMDAQCDIGLTGFSLEEIDDLLVEVETEILNDDDPYTAKIDTPVYEPSETVPVVSELYNENKTQDLRGRIKAAELPPEVERFLLSAAERHTVFHFNKIADYYASASAEVQALFEESALVIIDYEKAIEHGFVHLTKKMVEIVHGEGEKEHA
ncbi:ParB/Srx family N-terminal domain-containing protein [Pantoea vagans]|uniref:ParB/Srx family N-terminal domain-containing protein n=1 Tax=Pantoea vagans TaxID=470934 RepID=UPI00241C9DAF|nr:ParB/Srx family N-terminal domain-containing protein [Pantoea vagans]